MPKRQPKAMPRQSAIRDTAERDDSRGRPPINIGARIDQLHNVHRTWWQFVAAVDYCRANGMPRRLQSELTMYLELISAVQLHSCIPSSHLRLLPLPVRCNTRSMCDLMTCSRLLQESLNATIYRPSTCFTGSKQPSLKIALAQVKNERDGASATVYGFAHPNRIHNFADSPN